jgi:hypothetical protein
MSHSPRRASENKIHNKKTNDPKILDTKWRTVTPCSGNVNNVSVYEKENIIEKLIYIYMYVGAIDMSTWTACITVQSTQRNIHINLI